jgi:hypothetical protein
MLKRKNDLLVGCVERILATSLSSLVLKRQRIMARKILPRFEAFFTKKST